MKIIANLVSAVFISVASSSAFADHFENKLNYFSADTPQGKFECVIDKSTNNQQVLRLNSKVIFRQAAGKGIQGGDLVEGIAIGDVRCPDIVANHNGYLVIARSIQPPWYGLVDYAVINFNDKPATFTELVEAQSPQDEKVNAANRVSWDKRGFTLTYVGYKLGEYGGSVDSPKPRRYKVRLEFADDTVSQVIASKSKQNDLKTR